MALPEAYLDMRRTQPALAGAFEALGEAARAAGPLDGRAVALVKLGIAVAAGLEGGTHSAVRKALEAGCTRDELLHVVYLATPTIGWPAMMRGRGWVMDVVEKPEREGRG